MNINSKAKVAIFNGAAGPYVLKKSNIRIYPPRKQRFIEFGALVI